MTDNLRETHAALTTIGEEGGIEAVSLLGSLMDANHRSLEATYQSLYEGEKAARERAEERTRIAEDHLAQVEHRLMSLFRYDPDYWKGTS